ncbi:Gcp-like domain protein [Kalmanozyma brasiliensis GHG001]|uniref:N(6)-L-threonylcarbamoyladenine synthase n=1 Tax=Kalmanozyma brasiliensis (strain GHG001) TaxID=1365824 RepID=V5EW99_KALBG|nr:Gcp-like domain protein [Kalmanozyma brasiliensis GHG001]EST06549.1 Gcp-like domain protein [Kalmanozyma brasiliensis GHG001]
MLSRGLGGTGFQRSLFTRPPSHSAPFRRPNSFRGLSTPASKPRIILGIETSCDDSCASVVSADRTILSSIVTKQDHSSTGGIHPLSAALGHHAALPSTIATAITQANITHSDIDAIAVTQGPGMASSLGVGLSAAKTLSAVLHKPLIYVHHMQAHALTPLLTEGKPPKFPFLVLLVSGGHTMLVLARSVTEFRILATTTDDSIGDAFDKVARDLGIPWTSAPGAALEALARKSEGREKAVVFPIPCKGQAIFSYSGLKAAVQRHIEASGGAGMDDVLKAQIAAAFQRAACAQLEDKLGMALRPSHVTEDSRRRVYPRIGLPDGVSGDDIKTLVCSGGVASNAFIRSQLRKHLDELGRNDVDLQFPPLSLCTDNAAMIAWVGHLIWSQRTDDYTRHARPKWSMEDIPL